MKVCVHILVVNFFLIQKNLNFFLLFLKGKHPDVIRIPNKPHPEGFEHLMAVEEHYGYLYYFHPNLAKFGTKIDADEFICEVAANLTNVRKITNLVKLIHLIK